VAETKLDGLTCSNLVDDRGNQWKPTEKQLKFVEEYTKTGNASASYREAYPECSPNNAGSEGYKLLRNPNIKALVEQIQQDMRARFVLIAPEAQERLEYLSKTAISEHVRLQANLEILDRAGLDSPKKVELSGLGVFGEAKPDDLKDMIKRKCEEETPKDDKNTKE
jgi:phage terminase small subunit